MGEKKARAEPKEKERQQLRFPSRPPRDFFRKNSFEETIRSRIERHARCGLPDSGRPHINYAVHSIGCIDGTGQEKQGKSKCRRWKRQEQWRSWRKKVKTFMDRSIMTE